MPVITGSVLVESLRGGEPAVWEYALQEGTEEVPCEEGYASGGCPIAGGLAGHRSGCYV